MCLCKCRHSWSGSINIKLLSDDGVHTEIQTALKYIESLCVLIYSISTNISNQATCRFNNHITIQDHIHYLPLDQPIPITGLNTHTHSLTHAQALDNTRLTLDLKAWWDDILGPGAIIKNHSNEPSCAHNALQRGRPSQYLSLTCPIAPMQMCSAESQWEPGFLLTELQGGICIPWLPSFNLVSDNKM